MGSSETRIRTLENKVDNHGFYFGCIAFIVFCASVGIAMDYFSNQYIHSANASCSTLSEHWIYASQRDMIIPKGYVSCMNLETSQVRLVKEQ